jgi:hypothetical protein
MGPSCSLCREEEEEEEEEEGRLHDEIGDDLDGFDRETPLETTHTMLDM